MKAVMIVLVVLALIASSLVQAAEPNRSPEFSWGWRYNDRPFYYDALFSEFKYFNFQSQAVSGAITYQVASPMLQRKLVINAYFKENGKIWTVQKSYPLSCVTASSEQVTADFCGGGWIEISNAGPDIAQVRIVQAEGPLHWDLTYTAPRSQVTSQFSHFALDRTNIGPWAGIDWYMNWSPVMRSANVQGTVKWADGSRTLAVNTDTSYHDHNYEIWYPKSQPFNWLHYTGLDTTGRRVDLTLVEFPKSDAKTFGLTLYTGGSKTFWQKGRYLLTPIGEGRIPITRRSGDRAEELRSSQIDASFSSGEAKVPRRYRITTDDHQVTAEIEVTAALSTAKDASRSEDELLIDEQLLDARIRFLAPEGEMRTTAGPAEFMGVR